MSWQNLFEDITEEFSRNESDTDKYMPKIIADSKRVKITECVAARERIGEVWWAKLIRHKTAHLRTKTKTTGRPRGGALNTPRLEAKREKDRNRRRGMRERLPDMREGVTWHFTIHTRDAKEVDGYVTTGLYADGRVGELFVKMGKSEDAAWIDQWAIAFSMLLQLGTPLAQLCQKFIGTRFEPCGGTGSKDVPRCTSVVDLVCRWLMFRYGRL